jgi:hypothetical protein
VYAALEVTEHPKWQPGQAEIAAEGGAGRRSAKGAAAPVQSIARSSLRRGRSTPPRGGHAVGASVGMRSFAWFVARQATA